MSIFDWRAKTIAAACAPFCAAWYYCCPSITPWEFPNKANDVRHALCQVLKHGDKWQRDCESSCPCCYSQIEGLGLHVVYITRYFIRIKKYLRNQIEIIEIKSNCKEYELLYPLMVSHILKCNNFPSLPFALVISITWFRNN